VTRVGVITFPGSLDDRDAMSAIRYLGGDPVRLWHRDTDLQGVDAIILPGGFSYGDYLRTGALARFSPVMGEVKTFAEKGGAVVGICNGFQILCEAQLLPGALIRNKSLKFICTWADIRVESRSTPLTADVEYGSVLRIPVKHGEGQFVIDADDLQQLEDRHQVVFRYCAPDGTPDEASNINGSANSIAGIRNARGNVVGLMPHPEHAVDPDVGATGGAPLLTSLLDNALSLVRA